MDGPWCCHGSKHVFTRVIVHKGYCGKVYQMNLMLLPTIEFSQPCRNGFTDFADFASYFSKIVW